jgi:hypothetical protein
MFFYTCHSLAVNKTQDSDVPKDSRQIPFAEIARRALENHFIDQSRDANVICETHVGSAPLLAGNALAI